MVKAARVLACEDPTVNYGRKLADTRVVITDKGFNFEFSIDNKGNGFADGDTINFAFYYHDTNDWKNDDDYTKNLLKLPSKLDALAEGGFYTPESVSPMPAYNDTILFSVESASGRAQIKPATVAVAKSGDMLRDIINGSASVTVTWRRTHCVRNAVSKVS